MKKMLFYILVVSTAVFASAVEEASSLELKLANRSVTENDIVDRVRELSSESRSALMTQRLNVQMFRSERMERRLENMRENRMLKIREDEFRPVEQIKDYGEESPK